MKIRKFNENKDNDFLSLDEAKDYFAYLSDSSNILKMEMNYKYLSGDSEYHISDVLEEDDDIYCIEIDIEYYQGDYISFYVDYGVDSNAMKANGLNSMIEIFKEINDISSHLNGFGYDTHTDVNNGFIRIFISKKGTL